MKTVWIAGASRGLGAELARIASHQGHHVILSGRNTAALEAVRAALPHPQHATVLPADFADEASLPLLIDRIWSATGRVDVVFFCAGLAQWSDPLRTLNDVEAQLFAVNYRFPVQAGKELAARMLAQGSGHLIAIGSIAAEFGQAQSAAYGASKAALERHWEAFYAAWGPRGLKLQLVQPGVIGTSIMQSALDESGHPLGNAAKTHVGMDSAEMARRIFRATRSNCFKIRIVSPSERVALLLHRWMPTLFYTLLRKRHGTA
jgi:short-subunit dehydrogenase